MPRCFIIMPISTPESCAAKYPEDPEHFMHVLNHLFTPALEKAGYTPVPPKARGADLIHAEIIKNIESAELVLCDVSTLNPNVFFELGIRTAVNKPVCIVKDDQTENVPFDTGIVNYHGYASALRPWNSEQEINKLITHIQDSAKRSGDENQLWKYFGLTNRATLAEGKGGKQDKLDLLTLEIESLRRKLDEVGKFNYSLGPPHEIPERQSFISLHLTKAEIDQSITGVQMSAGRDSSGIVTRPAISSLHLPGSPAGHAKVSEKGKPNSPEEDGKTTKP